MWPSDQYQPLSLMSKIKHIWIKWKSMKTRVVKISLRNVVTVKIYRRKWKIADIVIERHGRVVNPITSASIFRKSQIRIFRRRLNILIYRHYFSHVLPTNEIDHDHILPKSHRPTVNFSLIVLTRCDIACSDRRLIAVNRDSYRSSRGLY
jgi:hypothetical protein